ncbi:MAG: Rieske 2Fe-2S domain-containing protein [Azonexus sp.]|jgi:nitrite reductase/ring-hydroxylating ferredoxin subunit/alkylhydroperoxidase/carboxymuconolactone decarboxylase family protein YurZ|nr:Rieske 2Fe-2S domain-containing protein [Azonexus sp.]
MSNALDYLIRARPEAMTAYFTFLKDAGSRLDPKTRNLISVITKVHAQTERGFKQYLRRALRQGCSGEEVIDALLMAFPALGLSKIVWATDIILAMDLPEFRLGQDTNAGDWHALMTTNDLQPGQTIRVDAGSRSVFIHRNGDGYRVYDSRCPHQTTDIPHLALDGNRLTCPKHKWVFDISTGACVGQGDAPLKQWPCKVEDGKLLARW